MAKRAQPNIPKDQIPGILTYNAWLFAIQSNCSCKACSTLRRLTPYMAIPIPTDQLQQIPLEDIRAIRNTKKA